MEKSTKQKKWMIAIVGVTYIIIVAACFLKPAGEYSLSERRLLAQKPMFSWKSMVTGTYAAQTEEYVTDQFPFRDLLRACKANFSMHIMQKKDNHDIYVKEGYLCAMEYPMDEASVERAASIFRNIYEKHLEEKEVSVYMSVIPDKSYYLADKTYLSMDYSAFLEKAYNCADFMTPIRIEDKLQLSDYYRTDTHWKQEEITETAVYIGKEMGVFLSGEYRVKTLDVPFYGVYAGQAALMTKPDEISYCSNGILDECIVYDYENNVEIPLYDESKAYGRDAYEMFLGGNISLATIENPGAVSEKELVVFGDSFSRSMVPLLAEGYRKTTLIDIRYLPSAYIGNYVTFENQDVLFLYSTSVLNNSITLK